MTSSMTLPGDKVGQSLKLLYFHEYFGTASIKKAQNIGNIHGNVIGILKFLYYCQ